jgi:hypothetical protein
MKKTGERGAAGRPKNTSPGEVFSHAPTLKELGITQKQAATWQKISAVPKDEFERILHGAAKPTSKMLANNGKPMPPQLPADATRA